MDLVSRRFYGVHAALIVEIGAQTLDEDLTATVSVSILLESWIHLNRAQVRS
jgi:hypothetical protein